MSNVISFPTPVRLHALPNGSVFRVLAPRVEGHKKVKNDGVYKKVGDSHSLEKATEKDCIFHRNTLVRVLHHTAFTKH